MEPAGAGRTEELLRLISEDAAELSIVLLDPDGTITSHAGGAPAVEGYEPDELLGKHFSIFMPEEERAAGSADALLRQAEERGIVETEGWRVRRDGTRYWANVVTAAARDAAGRLIGFVRITRDLSSRQRALDALRQDEERYRHIVENATDIIYTHDLQGRILTLNTAGTRIFGPIENLLGRSIFEVVLPEFHAPVQAMVAHQLEHGGSTTHELDVMTPAGQRVSLEVSTQLICEGDRPVAIQGIGRDITERRRAADAIERSERYFRTLLENAADAVTIINADGSTRYSSPAVVRLIGYTPEERRGQSVLEITHPEDVPIARAALAGLLAEPKAPAHFVVRGLHRDGGWRHFEIHARNLLADPEVNGIVVNWRDITPQVAAEQKLREREHFFRSIIERSNDILVVVDGDRKVRYVSPSSQLILNVAPQEVIGTSGLDFVHPDDQPEALRQLDLLFDRDAATTQAVLRLRTAGGDYRTFDVRARNLLADPLFAGVIVDAHDVTESKRFEEALRASERRFRNIIETSSEGMCICDADGRITFVNDRYAQMLGYDKNELLGVFYLDPVAPEDRERLIEGAAARQASREPQQLDVAVVRKDGRRIAVIASTTALFDEDDAYVGTLALITDITERKQLEAQLRQAQKMEAIGQLAGGIAHDFNNLLTAIHGHVDMLLSEVPADSELRHEIVEIRKGADRAAALTQQLLAFSRRQILQPRVLELDRVVADVETLVGRLIGEDIELRTQFAAGSACVRADRGRLEQVLVNLAVNARDAMPRGGTLKIETDVVDIDEEFVRSHPGARAGRFVRLAVQDTGVGMNPETLSHLFEPFFTTKALGRGTGLGLATVYGIVKQSDGYIGVTSRLGSGTRFEVLLPHVDASPEPPRGEAAVPPGAARAATILVAEDEASVRSLTCRILRKHGYRVLEAKHGADALEIAQHYDGTIDLLLTDIVMPALGGRELRDQLVALRPDVKVMFMSGYTDDALLQRGITEANGGFLEKPFTPDDLVAKVRAVLEAG